MGQLLCITAPFPAQTCNKIHNAGVPIERVSILLGHQSVRVTERHYNPWVRSRQEQLEADVARTWEHDPVLHPQTQLATAQKIPGTKQVQIN